MKVPKQVVETVEARFVTCHAKVCDSGSYELLDDAGATIAKRNDYVPNFFPGEHYGDYLELKINIETGQIVNWKTPYPEDVAKAFELLKEED